ncbi:951_t:CDS:2 [Ambispora gerdemannii]|uniref:951_t:CDS:1 n=1 Tax=Ambispora gerdemannii TaxID=144530 RepID=A0A9N9CJD6_9GLOM|nr:951_t:CDS:2 [Ambispora gerdemannii]
METRYSREVLKNQQLLKKGLSVNEYLYKVPKPILDRKKKSKEKKSKNVKNLLQSNDSLSLNEDEIANIKDVESQKLAKKWLKNYIKNLCNAPKKDEIIISHLWKDATTHAQKICPSISKAGITRPSGTSMRHNDYLNVLDKIADSIHLKLSDLLSKLSKLNVEYRNGLYGLIMQCEALIDFRNTWYKVIGLEITRLQALSIIQNSKKNDLSEADIDEIVNLYC